MSLFWNEKAKRKHQEKVKSMLDDFKSYLINKKKDYKSAGQVERLKGEVKLCETKQEALELEEKVQSAISYPSGGNGNDACRDAVTKLKTVIAGIPGFVESPEAISGDQRVKDLTDQLEQARQERQDAIVDDDRAAFERAKTRIKALSAQLSLEEKALSDTRNADVNASVARTSMETAAIREKAGVRGSEGVQEAIEANKEADKTSAAILKNQEELLSSTPISDAEESDFDKARAEYLLGEGNKKSNPGQASIRDEEERQ